LGVPDRTDINMLKSEGARQYLFEMGYKPKIPWKDIIPHGNPLGM
jgi:hypothetical protein